MSTAFLDPLEKSICDDVLSIAPLDEQEHLHIQDIADWIASGAPLFRVKKPDVPLKHLVSYFVLVDPEQNSLLLVDHIKAQLWLPTGGHVLPGEPPVETVKRESIEELNLSAVFLKNNTRPFFATVTTTVGLTPGHTDVSLWYLLRGNKHDFIHYDKTEFTDVEWFTFDEILESDPVIFDPHLQRFTQKLAGYLNN